MENDSLSRRPFLHRCLLYGTALTLSLGMSLPCRGKPTSKPNIVFVLTDQWRAQATGYAGDPNVKTPNLDALAAESIHFENTVSVCPVCTPYRASLMTGRYPLSTGMFLNDLYLPAEELCMAEILNKVGYETGYIGKWHLDGHGRDVFIPRERRQGFDYWKVLECTHQYNDSCYYAGDDPTLRKWNGYDAYAQTKDAQDYIRSHAQADDPFLLMVAYGGPHFPHHSAPQELKQWYPVDGIKLRPNVPEQGQDRAAKEAQGYYAHCSALDRCVGELLKTLSETGEAENTIFVFTSDHGEMLGSQGQPSYEKQRPWDESIRVPLLVRYPLLAGHDGKSVKTPVNTPDLLPTLLSLAGVAIPDTIEGEDLSRLIQDNKTDEDRAALVMSVSPFAGYSGGKEFRAIRTARYTYVCDQDGPWLMYDNQMDPYQMNNLIGDADHVRLQAELNDKLQSKLKQTGDLFFPKHHYLMEWGYSVDDRGCIPYFYQHSRQAKKPEDFKVQSPANKPK
ncbi:sulfatase family protein [Novipirellula artificiosorum]|uniref:Arylsulfatase n=1 Tax=Novipirellula artificiosorum TaxID=2528016 RepID=A0A5C6DNE5_9BACT|nr:sulfatase [Novipirellula artificiosorum]TWU38370.1 Arylsulfatase [Novipirellula artificiosorum]